MDVACVAFLPPVRGTRPRVTFYWRKRSAINIFKASFFASHGCITARTLGNAMPGPRRLISVVVATDGWRLIVSAPTAEKY